MGKTRYVNLHQCVYNSGAENFTSVVNVPNDGFDAGTNASNTADASQNCGPGSAGYPYVPQFQTSGLTSLDLLGNRFVNLHQCVYNGGADNFTSVANVPNNGLDAGTNASNTADASQNCGPGAAGYPYVPQFNTSGLTSMDVLNNRYINLHQCVYNGGADNYTSLVNVPDNRFDTGTNASNVVDANQSCGPGGAGYPYVPQFQTSAVTTLDTLDTTRGEGFVQYTIIAPTLDTTQVFDQSATLNGTGQPTDPMSSGTITVDPALAVPLVNPYMGGLALLAGLTGAGLFTLRRNQAGAK
ncbi:hypothetical protein [Streptomyces virginiae]|uniref:hypothetical protein n=1 Tax=Streptomyces virginiae TaxID=1961 RepID=UPI00331ED3A0